MKVKIKDLKPNPHRDMKNYPINPEKIESLKNSIEQTGFWDNILARKNNGSLEIAYGHHRLQVLKELYEPEHEVDIPIKEIDDSTMLRIMANENDESWGTSPKIINETVRVTKQYLEEHPETIGKKTAPRGGFGREAISKFLNGNWNEVKVGYALEQIKGSETKEDDEKHIDREAVESFPTQRASRDFVSAVKKAGNVTPKQQKRAAKKIIETKNFGEAAVRRAVLEEKHKKEPVKQSKQKMLLYDLRDEIKETSSLTGRLSSKLLTLTRFRDEIGDEVYREEIKTLAVDINVLMQRLKTFLGGKDVKRIKG